MSAAASSIKVLVVDDEPLARATLLSLLGADPEVVCVGACKGGHEAVARVRADDPDLIFLDVKMPGMGGFEVLDALGDPRRAQVVFVTAFEEYALRAFETSACDYLLKPFDDARFARALGRAKQAVRLSRIERVASELGALVSEPSVARSNADRPRWIERIVVRSAGATEIVDLRDLEYLEAEDYYVLLHVAERSILHRQSLRDLATLLPPNFVRVHRSTIVNTDCIREVRTLPGGERRIVLRGGVELAMSRNHRHALDDFLGKR